MMMVKLLDCCFWNTRKHWENLQNKSTKSPEIARSELAEPVVEISWLPKNFYCIVTLFNKYSFE